MPAGQRYGVEVRRAGPPDAPEVARLLAAADVSLGPADAAERLPAVLAHRDGAVLVTAGWSGLNGLVAVAWAPVLGHVRPLARLTTLVVDPDERRHGLGRLLLKAASQAARAAGCDALEVVDEASATLAAFCRATGFTAAGQGHVRSLRRRTEA